MAERDQKNGRAFSPLSAQRAQDLAVRARYTPVRKRIAEMMAKFIEAEVDRVESSGLPLDQQLALVCALEMMLEKRPTVSAKGKEVYLRLKGLLLDKKGEKARRQKDAQDAVARMREEMARAAAEADDEGPVEGEMPETYPTAPYRDGEIPVLRGVKSTVFDPGDQRGRLSGLM